MTNPNPSTKPAMPDPRLAVGDIITIDHERYTVKATLDDDAGDLAGAIVFCGRRGRHGIAVWHLGKWRWLAPSTDGLLRVDL